MKRPYREINKTFSLKATRAEFGGGEPDETFTLELPITRYQGGGYTTDGNVGYTVRTEDEQRRERRDWLAGVAPTPGVEEVRRKRK